MSAPTDEAKAAGEKASTGLRSIFDAIFGHHVDTSGTIHKAGAHTDCGPNCVTIVKDGTVGNDDTDTTP